MANNNLKIQASVEMPSAKQINDKIKALEKTNGSGGKGDGQRKNARHSDFQHPK